MSRLPLIGEESVISVAVLVYSTVDVDALRALSQEAELNFPYYEFLIVANPSQEIEAARQALLEFPNSRLILMNAVAPESILRATVFDQAIGDQVALIDLAETLPKQLPMLVQANIDGNSFTGLCYETPNFSIYSVLLFVFAKFIRWLAGFSFDPELSYTGCYDRALVNAINKDSAGGILSLQLSVARLGYIQGYLGGAAQKRYSLRQILRKISRSLDVIGSVPYRLCLITALCSALCCAGNLFYIAYILVVKCFASFVQPGWAMTSLVGAVMNGVIFFSIFCFSCIFSNHARQKDHTRFTMASDTSRNDFITIFHEINVTEKL